MAEFVVRTPGVSVVRTLIKRDVPGTADCVLDACRAYGLKPVCQTQIDVVEEPGAARPVVLVRVERLHDVLLASRSVLGGRRKAVQVDQKVLRPILNVLLGRRPARMLLEPVTDVFGKPLVELVKILGHYETIVSDVMPINEGERVAFSILIREIGKIHILMPDCCGIALHGDTSFRKDLNCMRASLKGREELATRVQQSLDLATKKEAERVVETVVAALEATLLNNLGTDGFALKLSSFGKFTVRHRPGILRKIGFSGETIQTKMRRKIVFVSLGMLRHHERVG